MVKYQERAKTCHWGHVMAWIVLVLSGICEAVWAVALDKSQGFTKIIPVIVFFCGLAASMAGLSYAMRLISVGTAYLIWVGIGAAITVVYGMVVGEESVSVLKMITVVYGMVVGEESVSVLKILCLIGMVACIAGLKLAG